MHGLELIRALEKHSVSVSVFPEVIEESSICSKVSIKNKIKLQSVPNIYELLVLIKRCGQALTRLPLIRERICEFKPDILLIRPSLYDLTPAILSKLTKLPVILEVNAFLYDERVTYYQMRNKREVELWSFFEKIEINVLKSVDSIYVVSFQLAEIIRQKLAGKNLKIAVIFNGVDLSRFTFNASETIPSRSGRIKIGFVGAFHPWHGIERLIDAMPPIIEKYPFVKLYIAGDGLERERLEYKVCSDGVLKEHVIFEGRIPHNKIAAFLLDMDILVAPYEFPDRFYFSPLKVFEYMAARKAIIASDCGQIKEILEKDNDALLISPGNNVALTIALEKLIVDTELRFRLGKRVFEKACGFTWDQTAEQLIKLMNDTLMDRKC